MYKNAGKTPHLKEKFKLFFKNHMDTHKLFSIANEVLFTKKENNGLMFHYITYTSMKMYMTRMHA